MYVGGGPHFNARPRPDTRGSEWGKRGKVDSNRRAGRHQEVGQQSASGFADTPHDVHEWAKETETESEDEDNQGEASFGLDQRETAERLSAFLEQLRVVKEEEDHTAHPARESPDLDERGTTESPAPLSESGSDDFVLTREEEGTDMVSYDGTVNVNHASHGTDDGDTAENLYSVPPDSNWGWESRPDDGQSGHTVEEDYDAYVLHNADGETNPANPSSLVRSDTAILVAMKEGDHRDHTVVVVQEDQAESAQGGNLGLSSLDINGQPRVESSSPPLSDPGTPPVTVEDKGTLPGHDSAKERDDASLNGDIGVDRDSPNADHCSTVEEASVTLSQSDTIIVTKEDGRAFSGEDTVEASHSEQPDSSCGVDDNVVPSAAYPGETVVSDKDGSDYTSDTDVIVEESGFLTDSKPVMSGNSCPVPPEDTDDWFDLGGPAAGSKIRRG